MFTDTTRLTHAIGRAMLAGMLLFAATPSFADTQATPAPTPAPTLPPIPAGWDPCGGPHELLNKIGLTPCVFVAGEAALTAQYASVNIPSNTALNITTPGGATAATTFSTAAHAFAYPATTVYVGVLRRAQISITGPTFEQVNSSSAAAFTGSNVAAAGAGDMTFAYKQLFLLNPLKFTMLGVDFAYRAPTGSAAFRGPGPSYTLNPILGQPLPRNLGVAFALPINNFTVVSTSCSTRATCTQTTSRGWSFDPELASYWESPGGTLAAVLVEHSFNPNVWPVTVDVTQLFGRHVSVYMSYGGLSYTAAGTGPFHGLVGTTTTTYPSVLSVGVNVLFGRSDIPMAVFAHMKGQ